MGLRFYYTQKAGLLVPGLFRAEYQLPVELRGRVGGERVAIVDDVISAGSSARATATELSKAGATIVVVGALLLLGQQAIEHFAAEAIPLVSVAQWPFNLWKPAECPLCRAGSPLVNPILDSPSP